MALAEVNAVFELVAKATSLLTQAQDGWYKRSAELDAFKDQVRMLTDRRLQWSKQLRRHGISEDPILFRTVKAAIDCLNEQQQAVQKMQRSRLLRFRKKAFPSDLSYAMGLVSDIVNSGPQLLVERAATHDLLDKTLAQTPAHLPFIHDRKYVPIKDSLKDIQKALENPDGPRIVTLYGEPGTGKSSLAKFVALEYQEQNAAQVDSLPGKAAAFPDGVQYLFCGLGAKERIRQLLLELLEGLGFGTENSTPNEFKLLEFLDSFGFGTGSFTPNEFKSAAGVPLDDYLSAQLSYQMKLKSRLVEQNLLIVLDDLWDMEVLKELLVPAKGLRYLITSQNREIWRDAEQIHLKRPTRSEARKIMTNHTAGLPILGEVDDDLKGVMDDIIGELAFHPLSLANVGMSIMRNRAGEASHWKEKKKHLHLLLDDERAVPNGPLAYEMPYNLTVSASMMVMVECIPLEAREVLDLMSLFEGPWLRQDLLNFFYACIRNSGSNYEYNSLVKYLEDRSLIETRKHDNEWMIEAHGLRTHYIREKRNLGVRDIAAQILGGSFGQHVGPVLSGDQRTLLISLSAMHFAEPFINLVASAFENQTRVMNEGFIPRRMNSGIDALQMVKDARGQSWRVRKLYPFLSPDGEEFWKQQAHEAATKVIIKFICKKQLDDESMAHLLQRPQTFSAACATLDRMTVCLSLSGEDTFSQAYSETMKTLLALLHSNLTPTKRRAAVVDVLPHVLRYETDDTILGVTKVWKELLAIDSEPALQIACTTAFQGRSVLPPSIIHEVWELCVALLTSHKNDEVRFSAGNTVLSIVERLDDEPWHREKLQTEYFPKALSMLFSVFVSHNTCGEIRVRAGLTLCQFSRVLENRVNVGRAVQEVWEGLVDMLFNRNEVWGGWDNIWVWEQDYDRQARVASQIIRDLSLTKELGEAFLRLPSLVERLLVAEVFEIAFRSTCGGERPLLKTTRTLTFLHSIKPDPRLIAFPPWSQVLEVCGDGRGGQPQLEVDYFRFCRSQVETYLQMESYADALAAIDVAEQRLKEVPENERDFNFAWTGASLVRCMRIYVQALSKDYAGALLGVNSNIKRIGENVHDLVDRAVLKRLSGDLQGSLDDLNATLPLVSGESCYAHEHNMIEHRAYTKSTVLNGNFFLKRGYMKHLMGDEEGARRKGESAHQLQRPSQVVHYVDMHTLFKQPMKYLNLSCSLGYLISLCKSRELAMY